MGEPQIHESYVGTEEIRHVEQPEGTELSFAATVASALGYIDIGLVGDELAKASISEQDGTTMPLWERATIPIGDTILVVDPILSPGQEASHAEEACQRIAERLEYDEPIALLFDKNPDSTTMEDAEPHWVLIAGFDESFRVDILPHWSQTNGVHIMDPEAGSVEVLLPYEFARRVEHSFETLGGVYAYALLGPQAFYDVQAREQIDRLDGQGWHAISWQADQDANAFTASFTLGLRENSWSYDEVEEILRDVAGDDEAFLEGCAITIGESELDDLDIDYVGNGIEGLEKLVDALVVLGERPIDEEITA